MTIVSQSMQPIARTDCMFLVLSHFQQLQMFLPLGPSGCHIGLLGGGGGIREDLRAWRGSCRLDAGRWRILAVPPTPILCSDQALTHLTHRLGIPYFISMHLFMPTLTVFQTPKWGTSSSNYDHTCRTMVRFEIKTASEDLDHETVISTAFLPVHPSIKIYPIY